MSHFYRQRPVAPLLDERRQLGQPMRCEAGRQLQPVRRYPFAKRCQQLTKLGDFLQLLAEVIAVADIARQLGTETKVRWHRQRPARYRLLAGPGVERGVAFHRIEHFGVATKKLGWPGILRIQRGTPGSFAPGWATEKIGKRNAHRSR